LLPPNRVAATRAKHEDIVRATYLDLLLAGTEGALDSGSDRPVRRLLAETIDRNEFAKQLLGRQRAVPDERHQVVRRLHAGIGERLREVLAIKDALLRNVVSPQLLFEHLASQIDGASPLFETDQMLDLVSRVRRRDEVEPVAARLVSSLGNDLDDVAVLEV